MATIGDVCDVANGGTPKTGVSAYWGGQHQWITPAEMGKRSTPYVSQTERTITDQGLLNSSARPLPALSVILSSRAPIGHLVINTEPMATNQGCKGLIPRKSIDHKFLYYYLGSIVELLNDLGTGATFKELSGGKLKEVAVPLPLLPEQQRIVTLLDEAFDGIATAKAKAEKNLQNARAIFESLLQSVFTDRAKEWPVRLLGDVFHIGSSKRIYETDWTTQGVPFFGGREIVKLAKFGSVESASFISEEKYQEYASKYEMPRAGDILMTARGTIGVGYIVKPGDKFYYKDGNVISLSAKSPSNPQFVLYAFRSNAILDQLTVLEGTTVSHLPIEKAKMLKVCVPTFEVQNFIVDHLEMVETHSKDLESLYQRKLTALDELKKSLLAQAFSGAL